MKNKQSLSYYIRYFITVYPWSLIPRFALSAPGVQTVSLMCAQWTLTNYFFSGSWVWLLLFLNFNTWMQYGSRDVRCILEPLHYPRITLLPPCLTPGKDRDLVQRFRPSLYLCLSTTHRKIFSLGTYTTELHRKK